MLLSCSPPLISIMAKNPVEPVSPVRVGSGCKVLQHKGVTDDGSTVLDADGLIARFPMLQKGGCQLVYQRRKTRRCGQVPVVDDDSDAG
ncbi:hypothetical protein Hanom_Chr14g01261141 [Helianthus anomalus]